MMNLQMPTLDFMPWCRLDREYSVDRSHSCLSHAIILRRISSQLLLGR
jgi:hypothetical protein